MLGLGLQLPKHNAIFGGFTPPDIPDLKLWLDASQIAGLNDGDAVTTWNDLSGQVNNVTQAVGVEKPTYQTGELNGYPIVRFDGVDDNMATAVDFGTNNSLSGDAEFSIFCVYKKNSATLGTLCGWGNMAVALEAAGFYDDNVTRAFAYAGGNSLDFNAQAAGTFYTRTYVKSAGAILANSTSRKNGASDATGAGSSNTPNISGGDPFNLGQWSTYVVIRLSADVAELIIYASALSGAQISQVEEYLRAKYAHY